MNAQNHNKTNYAKLSNAIIPARYNVKKIFYTILYSIYVALSLSYFIWAIKVIILIPTLLGLFALMLLSTRIRREYVPIYIFIGFLVTSFLISSLIVGRTGGRSYIPICFILSSAGIAMILIRGYVYSWGGYIVFYSLTAYFLMLIIAGVDVHFAMKYSSVNGISIVMLIACISLYIILSIEKKKIDIKPALFTLAISFWAIGSGGIAVSFVLLLGILFVKLRKTPKYMYFVIICLLIVYVFYASSIFRMDYSFFGNAIDHYLAKKYAMEPSPRWVMWTNYFYNMDVFRLIFGVNVVEDPWPEGEINEFNYHNSFINLHLQTGFMGLITLALIIYSLYKFIRINQVFHFLLLALILRSSVDLFIFFSRFDFIPFFFLFYFMKSANFRAPHIKPLSAGIR